MGFFNSSMLMRAGAGAGLGAGVGAINGGWGGAISGGLAGAGAGAAMTPGNIGRLRGGFDKGLNAMSVGLGKLASNNKIGGVRGVGRGIGGMQNALGHAQYGMDKLASNKWGGRGLQAMGVGSAALIGSSMLNSNRGY